MQDGHLFPLTLPPTSVSDLLPALLDLAATELLPGEVDLSWLYDANLADNFAVVTTGPFGMFSTMTNSSADPSFALLIRAETQTSLWKGYHEHFAKYICGGRHLDITDAVASACTGSSRL